MNSEQFKTFSLSLMSTADVLYLTTISADGYPHTRAIFNLRNRKQFPSLQDFFLSYSDDLSIFFGTNTSSVKVRQMKANPHVNAYFCRADKFHGLMFAAQAEFVNDPQLKKALWQNGWERYYSLGPVDHDYTLVRLVPEYAKGWYHDAPVEISLKNR